MPDPARLVAEVTGDVQGVGFRWATRQRAEELGLSGSARNLPDGAVRVEVEGDRRDCAAMLAWLRGPVAPGRVDAVTESWQEPLGAHGFLVG